MELDTLLGKNLLPEFADLSILGEDVTAKLHADSSDVVGIYKVDDMKLGDVVEQLKKAGYEESSVQSDYYLMIVDEDSLTVKESIYFR